MDCAGLVEGCSPHLTFFYVVLLVSVVLGVLQPHPHVGFSQWCLVCEWLLGGVLVRGTEVKMAYVVIFIVPLPKRHQK